MTAKTKRGNKCRRMCQCFQTSQFLPVLTKPHVWAFQSKTGSAESPKASVLELKVACCTVNASVANFLNTLKQKCVSVPVTVTLCRCLVCAFVYFSVIV